MAGACGFLGYLHYRQLIERGFTPLKDKSYLTNGYLDNQVDWIPGMQGIRLRDRPSFWWTLDDNEFTLKFIMQEISKDPKASAVILNMFEELEHNILATMRSLILNTYSIGPLPFLCDQLPAQSTLSSMGSNLWTEDKSCLELLDIKEPGLVVYVNYDSITVVSMEQMNEFAWELANSNHPFLWIIRSDLIMGEVAMLPEEFVKVTAKKGCWQASARRNESFRILLWGSSSRTPNGIQH